MSSLEHLIENGLCRLNEGISYEEWMKVMRYDSNLDYHENISLDDLWEICQYVIYTWDLTPKEVTPDIDSEGTCTCGSCGETVGYYPAGCKTPHKFCKFCPECGKLVKW